MAAADPPQTDKPHAPGSAVVVALVLVLAFQLAYWTWFFVAPKPAARAPEARDEVDLAAIARLFGAAAPSGAASA